MVITTEVSLANSTEGAPERLSTIGRNEVGVDKVDEVVFHERTDEELALT